LATRLAKGRREELLDGAMGIIAARGFSDVRVSELAAELHCSVASLYKIAPSKDSLVLLAIGRWQARTFANLELRAEQGTTASERARFYFIAGAESLRPLCPAFVADVRRFESTRSWWWANVSCRFVDRFVELVVIAQEADQVRPINQVFLGEMLRALAPVTADARVLGAAGLSSEEATLEIDRIIWGGIGMR
jgi:AcrR family transcriptional regulator